MKISKKHCGRALYSPRGATCLANLRARPESCSLFPLIYVRENPNRFDRGTVTTFYKLINLDTVTCNKMYVTF